MALKNKIAFLCSVFPCRSVGANLRCKVVFPGVAFLCTSHGTKVYQVEFTGAAFQCTGNGTYGLRALRFLCTGDGTKV